MTVCGTQPAVCVLTTGGKIDDDDMAQNERWFGKVRNGLGVYLDQLRLPDCDIKIIPVMSRGEHAMSSEDRYRLAGKVRQVLEDQNAVVVTHDIESMVETGRYLKYALGELQAPVVLTGALGHRAGTAATDYRT